MSEINQYLITENSKMLQIPYKEYKDLVEKAEEGRRCRAIKEQVLAELSRVVGMQPPVPVAEPQPETAQAVEPDEATPAEPEKAEEVAIAESAPPAPEPVEVEQKAPPVQAAPRTKSAVDVPPIKQDVAAHFNRVDESGRLFNVFKQYYTCLNDDCGGTARVTIKDGICSLWNYDQWEEFAFVDVFDDRLRIGVGPRYTEALKSLDLCEVPRLLASRHNLVCVQVNDLNQTVLDTLVQAFNEAGAPIR